MGRGRKSKKQAHARDDIVSAEDEKLPARRRGRPQKLSKDDFDNNDDVKKIEEERERERRREETEGFVVDKSIVNHDTAADGEKKRKMDSSEVSESADSVKEEKGVAETKTCGADSIKSVGYRQIGSRRKNKPRRAAEVGVECV